jgi:hypothetical protein
MRVDRLVSPKSSQRFGGQGRESRERRRRERGSESRSLIQVPDFASGFDRFTVGMAVAGRRPAEAITLRYASTVNYGKLCQITV